MMSQSYSPPLGTCQPQPHPHPPLIRPCPHCLMIATCLLLPPAQSLPNYHTIATQAPNCHPDPPLSHGHQPSVISHQSSAINHLPNCHPDPPLSHCCDPRGCSSHCYHPSVLVNSLAVAACTGWDTVGWDGMGWDGMGWDGMGWDGMVGTPCSLWDGKGWLTVLCVELGIHAVCGQ